MSRGPSGLDDPFASAADQFGGMVRINDEELPIAGMTLGQIRHRLADRFRIEPGSSIYVDGERVDDESRIVRTGEHVEFIRPAGEKGCRLFDLDKG
jgi:hypothetical protein